MIEAYFHTMLLLQRAFRLNETNDTPVFVDAGTEPTPIVTEDQWFLGPGPVDLHEGSALVPRLIKPRETGFIGVGIVDANESQRDVYGTRPIQVTVSVVVGFEPITNWFRGKAASQKVAEIEHGEYPGTVERIEKNTFQDHCDIKPNAGGYELDTKLPGITLMDFQLRTIRALGSESYVPYEEDDLQVFWRNFVMEFTSC